MYPRFNEMVEIAVDHLMPDGFDVTDNPSECDTQAKVRRWYNATGRIMVWTGESEQTIFGAPHINHAFRAWHDYVHVVFGLPFTPQGEHLVMKIQQRQVLTLGSMFTAEEQALFLKLLECEIDAQVQYYETHGEFVKDQRAFAERWMAA
jgi:hypothetical protein